MLSSDNISALFRNSRAYNLTGEQIRACQRRENITKNADLGSYQSSNCVQIFTKDASQKRLPNCVSFSQPLVAYSFLPEQNSPPALRTQNNNPPNPTQPRPAHVYSAIPTPSYLRPSRYTSQPPSPNPTIRDAMPRRSTENDI